MKTIPSFHPLGMLRMSNFVPDKIVEFTHSHQLIQANENNSIDSGMNVSLRPQGNIHVDATRYLV